MPSLFYSNQHSAVVVDEICKCGHTKSEHGSDNIRQGGQIIRLSRNEGSCCTGECACSRFRWAGWITESEAVKRVVSRRKRQSA